jgi:formylglycine-generating enzyme required for sulfatase activity
MPESRPLRVFLCHASQDKPKVRDLYKRLKSEGFIQPWLDEEDLLPGQDFDLEIDKAIRDADVIIICLSTVSVAKEGYVNREVRRALDVADEKLEGAIYIIPLRLDDCSPSFERLKKLHWVDYFTPNQHKRLIEALRTRARDLKLSLPTHSENHNPELSTFTLDLYSFVQIPPTPETRYTFSIGKYPVTNAQYARFLNAPDYAKESYWHDFLKFNENCVYTGRWANEGWDWLQEKISRSKQPPMPKYWNDVNFGSSNPEHPVVGVTWYEANAYCNWLLQHWNELDESRANPYLRPRLVRLPLETEWIVAAGGNIPDRRKPWDLSGKVTTDEDELVHRANLSESNIGHTTPVNTYPLGASTYGVMDMIGNIWEWQAHYHNMEAGLLSLKGGSWNVHDEGFNEVKSFSYYEPHDRDNRTGFRLVVFRTGGIYFH